MYLRKLVGGMLCLYAALTFAAPPNVVTTIQPLQAIAQDLMKGVGEPTQLLANNTSPHVTALKPSQRIAVEKADLVVWVGPELEVSLKPIIAEKNPDQILTLSQMPHSTRYFMRDDKGYTEHAYSHTHREDNDSVYHEHIDPHMWLDPMNMIALTQHLSNKLKKLDPEHAAIYEHNEKVLTEKITQLDKAVCRKLAPVRDKPYMVYHDAYQYYEKQYGLNNVGIITQQPDAPISAARMRDIKRTIKDKQVVCIFSEPQFKPAIVEALSESTGVKTGELDPVGNSDQPGFEAYEALMQNIADGLVGCLG